MCPLFYTNTNILFKEILERLIFRHGNFQVIDTNNGESSGVFNYLLNCKGEYFLDFLEDIFNTEEFRIVSVYKKERLREDINFVLIKDNIKFELTPYKEYHKEDERGWNRLESITYPKIICKDNLFINTEVIEPAIQLLMDDKFKNANDEFLEALEHYKYKRYKEAIVSSCCALESVMKIICSINKWEYKQNATGLPLIKNIIEKSESPNWYEGIIMPALTLRNKLGPHGKGNEDINVTRGQAQLQINLVATQIIFLIEEYR